MLQIKWTPEIGAIQAALGLPDRDGKVHKAFIRLLASIDDEKYGWPAPFKPVTEIGIAFLHPLHLSRLRDIRTTPLIDILTLISCYHLRPKESGHLRNGKDWGGKDFDKAGDYDFGLSEWVSRAQIEPAVRKLLQRPSFSIQGGTIPVTMITQGGPGDLNDIGKFAQPPLDFTNLSSIVDTIDLQDIWRTAAEIGGRVGLDNILSRLGLVFINQHNAANDAMAQLVCTIVIAMEEYWQRNPALRPADKVPANKIMSTLSTEGKTKLVPFAVGTHNHCVRCGDDHLPGTCYWYVGYCNRCLQYNNHSTENCPFGANEEKLEERRKKNHDRNARYLSSRGRRVPEYVSLVESGLTRLDHLLEPLVPRMYTPPSPSTNTTTTSAHSSPALISSNGPDQQTSSAATSPELQIAEVAGKAIVDEKASLDTPLATAIAQRSSNMPEAAGVTGSPTTDGATDNDSTENNAIESNAVEENTIEHIPDESGREDDGWTTVPVRRKRRTNLVNNASSW